MRKLFMLLTSMLLCKHKRLCDSLCSKNAAIAIETSCRSFMQCKQYNRSKHIHSLSRLWTRKAKKFCTRPSQLSSLGNSCWTWTGAKKTHFPMFNKLNCGFISLCLEFSSAVCCWTNIGNRERTGRRILDKSRRRALGPTNNKAFKMFLGAFHWMRKFSAISERPTECTGLLCFATSRHLKASLLTSLS